MRPLKAGVTYFLLVFAVGWIMGPIRELCAVPRFGRVMALLFEAVIMLIAMIISARWVMRCFRVPHRLSVTLTIGLIAIGLRSRLRSQVHSGCAGNPSRNMWRAS